MTAFCDDISVSYQCQLCTFFYKVPLTVVAAASNNVTYQLTNRYNRQDESAVNGYHCPGDMAAVCMLEVLAILEQCGVTNALK